jgi:enoyl-CoA hydratase/carnithine racemase
MAYQFASYEKKGRIAVVTISRPERMNALHPPANFELHEIWSDFEQDPDGGFEMALCAPLSVRASKQAAAMGLGHPLDIALAMNYTENTRMRRSEDAVEGPRAFAEKRRPHWKAR